MTCGTGLLVRVWEAHLGKSPREALESASDKPEPGLYSEYLAYQVTIGCMAAAVHRVTLLLETLWRRPE